MRYEWIVTTDKGIKSTNRPNRPNRYIVALAKIEDSTTSESGDKKYEIFKVTLDEPVNKEILNNIEKIPFNKLGFETFDLCLKIPTLRKKCYKQFSTKHFIEVDSNSNEGEVNVGDVYQKMLSYGHLWREFIEKQLPFLLINNSLNIISLLLLQRFIQFAHQLAETNFSKRLSSEEKKDIILRCYLYRLIILKRIIDQNYLIFDSKEHDDITNNVIDAYKLEGQRLIQYLSDESFSFYSVPDDLQMFFSQILLKPHVTLDDIIDEVLIDFFDVSKSENESKVKLKEYATRVVNDFYLPRYKVFSSVWRFNKFNKMLLMNLFIPRLLAAITIGFLPLLLTGEIYQWFVVVLMQDISWTKWLLFWLSILFCEGIVSLYLLAEIKNYLGFYDIKRFAYVLLVGNLFSYCISIFGTIFMGKFFIIDQISNNGISNQELFYFMGEFFSMGFPISLIILQASFSLLLGIIIQAVWEDKPITQPL